MGRLLIYSYIVDDIGIVRINGGANICFINRVTETFCEAINDRFWNIPQFFFVYIALEVKALDMSPVYMDVHSSHA